MIDDLFRSPLLRVGRFRCPPDDAAWRAVNEIDSDAVVAFPGTSVVIQHAGREPVLANRNHVMFYNRGQRYRRRLHDPRGDDCVFVAPSPGLLAEILPGRADLPFVHGPGAPDAYLAQHQVARHLVASTHGDALYVEESLCYVLERVIADAFALNRRRGARRRSTREAHHELAESAKAWLTEHAAERFTLAGLARRLNTSPFHLARVFRAATGYSLHEYRNQLRLRLALEQLSDGETELGVLAHRLGFASHSHFTDAFRAAFGAPPSRVRAEGRRSTARLRTIVVAQLERRT